MIYKIFSFPDFGGLFNFSGTDGGYKWTQKTIYRAPVPDHAAHIQRACDKRERKRQKLLAIELKSKG